MPAGTVPLLALVVVPAVALTGCASQQARAETPAAPRTLTAPAAAGPAADGALASAAVPSACSLVGASDVSLYVALASWDVAEGEQDGRSVCRLTTSGFTVTAVAMRLAAEERAPDGLCHPPGSRAGVTTDGLLCAYQGPETGSSTAVGSRAGVAVGVRVAGPDAATKAAALAVHALSHL
jgi:hypothetical protein